MPFPYIYDFRYYSGDLYQFVMYPKNEDGTQFDLSDKTALFSIATERGNLDAIVISASPQISASPSRLLCTILPNQGSLLTGASYVYDIEIRDDSEEVITFLTGNITVQQNVLDDSI